jgi:hypothetical protein
LYTTDFLSPQSRSVYTHFVFPKNIRLTFLWFLCQTQVCFLDSEQVACLIPCVTLELCHIVL